MTEELLKGILKQLELQTKIINSAFDSDDTPKMGFAPLPSQGKRIVSIALIPDQSKGSIFKVYNTESTEKNEDKKWESVPHQSIFGVISNASVYVQKAAKASHNDSHKLYLFFDIGNEVYSVRTGIASYFVRGMINTFKGMTDDQLRSPIYFSGVNNAENDSYNEKVLFARILDASGNVYREPDDDREKEVKNKDWNDNAVQYCEQFVERLRLLNNTVVDPLMTKKLKAFLDSKPPFDKVEEKKLKIENDEAFAAKFGDRLGYAKYLINDYLSP